MKQTRNMDTALERLASHLGAKVLRAGKKGARQVKLSPPERDTRIIEASKPARALCSLVAVATTAPEFGGYGITFEEVREVVGLNGMPASGLAAHEEFTLMALVGRGAG